MLPAVARQAALPGGASRAHTDRGGVGEQRGTHLRHLHKLREQALRDGREVVSHQSVVAPPCARSALPQRGARGCHHPCRLRQARRCRPPLQSQRRRTAHTSEPAHEIADDGVMGPEPSEVRGS